jgi:hypothetical protein
LTYIKAHAQSKYLTPCSVVNVLSPTPGGGGPRNGENPPHKTIGLMPQADVEMAHQSKKAIRFSAGDGSYG